LKWFLTHKPGRAGLCARHTWMSTGAPALGLPSAAAVIKHMKKIGYWETKRTNIPKGAIVGYTGGSKGYGHLCLYNGNGTIATTDPHGPNTVGIVDLSFPERKWGMKYAGWTYHYGNVELPRK
jgi:hypothetical protein